MLGGNVDSIYIYTKWSRCFLNSEWINPTDSQNLYPPQLGLHWRLNKQRCNSSNMMEYVSVCIGKLFLFLAMNMILNLWLASSVPVGLCSCLFFCCCPSSLSGRFFTKSWPNSLCVLVPFGTLFLSYLSLKMNMKISYLHPRYCWSSSYQRSKFYDLTDDSRMFHLPDIILELYIS